MQEDLFGLPVPVSMPAGLARERYWKNKPLDSNTVYVGRPTKWGNPFVVGAPGSPDRPTAVRLFRDLIQNQPALIAQARIELRGRN